MNKYLVSYHYTEYSGKQGLGRTTGLFGTYYIQNIRELEDCIRDDLKVKKIICLNIVLLKKGNIIIWLLNLIVDKLKSIKIKQEINKAVKKEFKVNKKEKINKGEIKK